jgi:SNF2 family DNA or RNA helicase
MLFKHQTEALQWLLSQHVARKGSILADEMGLGKTISAIALLSTLYTTYWESIHKKDSSSIHQRSIGPVLIVCPATCISQWVSEVKLWTSSLPEKIPILTF